MIKKLRIALEDRIKGYIKPVIESEEVELVDVEYKNGPNGVLRIFIDKVGGVNISDCAKISSRVSELLDLEDIIEEKYLLEVSSPGLDRPFKNEEDYKRNLGKLLNISLFAPLEGKKKYIGVLRRVQDSKIDIEEKSGNIANIPISAIAKGRLEIVF